jgi:hypothetical protein
VAVAVVVLVALSGCGTGAEDPPPTTVTTEAPTTTVVPDTKGIECLKVATEALSLVNDFRQSSRGVVGPTEPTPEKAAAGRAKAAELRAEHARLGCPGEILRGFLA